MHYSDGVMEGAGVPLEGQQGVSIVKEISRVPIVIGECERRSPSDHEPLDRQSFVTPKKTSHRDN